MKTCKHCGTPFNSPRPLQAVCSPVCAYRHVKAAKKAEAVQTRERKQAMKPIRDLVAAAQEVFNKWVRARDADLPCVSCGVENPPMTSGGQWDAGHFLNRGSHPALRFNEDNCHKQCKSCNGGAKYPHLTGSIRERYQAELLNRIGPDRLAVLLGPHPEVKLNRDELIAIRATYIQRLKDLKKETA